MVNNLFTISCVRLRNRERCCELMTIVLCNNRSRKSWRSFATAKAFAPDKMAEIREIPHCLAQTEQGFQRTCYDTLSEILMISSSWSVQFYIWTMNRKCQNETNIRFIQVSLISGKIFKFDSLLNSSTLSNFSISLIYFQIIEFLDLSKSTNQNCRIISYHLPVTFILFPPLLDR